LGCSADGSKIIALCFPGLIYTSTNLGANWLQTTAPTQRWGPISCSADANVLATTAEYGLFFRSTNSGVTWEQRGVPSPYFGPIAMSADASRMVGVGYGSTFTSTNQGMTWLPASPLYDYDLTSIACSADGQKLVLGSGNFQDSRPIYLSTNFGASWAPATAPLGYWSAVCSSADGSKLAAVNTFNTIYTSTNSGLTWVPTPAPSKEWTSISSSADGKYLIASAYRTPIYISVDSGTTWNPTDTPTGYWSGVISSADGGRLFGILPSDSTGFKGSLYISQSIVAPTLRVALSENKVLVAWTIPSSTFVLQQNFDPASANWTDVTNLAVSVNLDLQVTLGTSPGRSLFRLKSL
jgi:photosystem II stability/assembly factor-like uncharacterized protein